MGPLCTETRRTEHGYTRGCVLEVGHDDDHMDDRGQTWQPPGATLQELAARWGRTHRFAWTGVYWIATHRQRRTHWRSEIEYTPAQLEERLRAHHGPPPGPPMPRPKEPAPWDAAPNPHR